MDSGETVKFIVDNYMEIHGLKTVKFHLLTKEKMFSSSNFNCFLKDLRTPLTISDDEDDFDHSVLPSSLASITTST